MPNKIKNIYIHCSDSGWATAHEIRKWHIARGWNDIGYHFVIQNGRPDVHTYFPFLDGQIEAGRQLDDDQFLTQNEIGSQVYGANGNSIGICLVGRMGFTREQLIALKPMVLYLIGKFQINIGKVLGHCEAKDSHGKSLSGGKTCPNLPMDSVREYLNGSKSVEELSAEIPIYIASLKI
jgi:hypothetical protein